MCKMHFKVFSSDLYYYILLFWIYSSKVEHLPVTVDVAGSNPVISGNDLKLKGLEPL